MILRELPSYDRVLDGLIRDVERSHRYQAAILKLSATTAKISTLNHDSELARVGLVCLRVDDERYEIVTQVPAIVKYERGEFRGFRGGVSSWQPY